MRDRARYRNRWAACLCKLQAVLITKRSSANGCAVKLLGAMAQVGGVTTV